jgi:hypothetical protein
MSKPSFFNFGLPRSFVMFTAGWTSMVGLAQQVGARRFEPQQRLNSQADSRPVRTH